MTLQQASRLRVAEDITELVGETPMLHLRKLPPPGVADVYAKLEYLNPGGSIKDRAAIGIIKRAEAEGRLHPGSTILEATAGNTGIGLALIGVNRGYRVIVCIPQKFAKEKVVLMQALGAEVIRTPDDEGMRAPSDARRNWQPRFQARSWPVSFPTRPIPTTTTKPPPAKSGSRCRRRLTPWCSARAQAAPLPA